MKKQYLLLFFAFCMQLSFAQTLQWGKGFGGTGSDMGSGVAVDDSANVYLTGKFSGTTDFDPGPGIYNLTSNGGTDIYVAKFDSTGLLKWAFRIGNVVGDEGISIAIDNDGNILLTGAFLGPADFDPSANVATVTPCAQNDIFLAKYTRNGQYVWAKDIYGWGYDYGCSISAGPDNKIYISGRYNKDADFDPSGAVFSLVSVNQSTDAFVACYNPDGSFVWAKSVGGRNQDISFSSCVDGNSNVYLFGYFADTINLNPGGINNFISRGSNDLFLVKLDPSGNYIWATSIGGKFDDISASVITDKQNNVYIGGRFQDTVDFNFGSGTNQLISDGGPDGFIASYDPNGNFRWVNKIGNANWDNFSDLKCNNAGNIFATGTFNGTVDFDPLSSHTSLTSTIDDIYILSFSNSGAFKWVRNIGVSNSQYSTGIAVNNKNHLAVNGYFYGAIVYGGVTTTSLGSSDLTAALYSYPADTTTLTINTTLCQGDSLHVGTHWYSQAGTYHDTIHTHQIDSIITTTISLISNSSSDTTATSCGSFVWYGTTYNTSGNKTHVLTNAAGCDSIITLHLSINNSTSSESTVITCDTYTWNGITYTTSGDKTFTTTNSAGCDSIATLHLTIKSSSSSETTVSACNSYIWNGNTYTTSGDKFFTTINAIGCDSIATLHLTINNSSSSETIVNACNSYTWNGNTYTSNGTYTYTTVNASGCDSIATLHLTVNNSNNSISSATGCENYTWTNGQTYTNAGTYTHTFQNIYGCDSIATLVLNISTINDQSVSISEDTICEGSSATVTIQTTETGVNYSLRNGINVIDGPFAGTGNALDLNSGTLTSETTFNIYAEQNIENPALLLNGSDDHISANPSFYNYGSEITVEAWIKFEGEAPWMGQSAYGTDNMGSNIWIIHSASGNDFTFYVNDDWTWRSVTSSGITNGWHHIAAIANSNGLYVYIDGNLNASTTSGISTGIVNNSNSLIVIGKDIRFPSDPFYKGNYGIDNFRLWDKSRTQGEILASMFSELDSTESNLRCNITFNDGNGNTTFLDNSTSHALVTLHNPDANTTWEANPEFGTYTCTKQLTAQPSVFVKPTTNSTNAVSSCDSYTWIDGVTYTSNNSTATFTLTNSAGCDSVVTLNLTINNSNTGDTSATACNNFTWYGIDYSSSGDYAKTFTNLLGCDSVVTLHLTISNSFVVSLGNNDTLCSNNNDILILDAGISGMSYLWNDNSTNQTLTVNSSSMSPGIYDYSVTVTDGICTDTDSVLITVEICSGISAGNVSEFTHVYPNPSTDGIFNVDIQDNNGNYSFISIYDATGRKVFENKYNTASYKVDLRGFAVGMYTLVINTEKQSESKRIIITDK